MTAVTTTKKKQLKAPNTRTSSQKSQNSQLQSTKIKQKQAIAKARAKQNRYEALQNEGDQQDSDDDY